MNLTKVEELLNAGYTPEQVKRIDKEERRDKLLESITSQIDSLMDQRDEVNVLLNRLFEQRDYLIMEGFKYDSN